MVLIKSNAQLDEEEKAALATANAESAPGATTDKFKTSLAGYLDTKWESARRSKITTVEPQMIANLRQALGIYEPKKLAAIKSMGAGSDVNLNQTGVKCFSALAWILDVLFQPSGKCWGVIPTPVPEIDSELMSKVDERFSKSAISTVMGGDHPVDVASLISDVQSKLPSKSPTMTEDLKKIAREIAEQKAQECDREINDKLVEGKWYEALSACIYDLVYIKTGFIKGPMMRYRDQRKIEVDPTTGKKKVVVKSVAVYEYERRSPFEIYPESDSTGIDDGYLFDHVAYRHSDLVAMRGLDGFNTEAIDRVLAKYVSGGLREWTGIESERATLEKRDVQAVYNSDKIEGLEYYGSVPGSILLEWGMSAEVIKDPLRTYEIRACKIGDEVIQCVINPDPLGRKPFAKASYEEQNDSFWGRALPEKISAATSVCNAAARALVNNLGMGSGPQVEINIDRLHGGDKGDTRLIPWKRWITHNKQQATGKAIEFFQPQMHAQEIMGVLKDFSKIVDESGGIPGYAHGDPQVGGAGNALADYETVLTPTVPVPISSLKIGDVVMGSNGLPCNVMGVFPQGMSHLFRLFFSNGTHVDCDENHRWSVRDHHDRKFRTLTTSEIISKGIFRKTRIGWRNPKGYRPKWMIPVIDSVQFNERNVEIDPYTMGVLIGDGDARCRVTSMDREIFDRIPYQLGRQDRKESNAAWAHTVKGIKKQYHAYGLNVTTLDKFIPEDYLYNSKEVRLELLRGLMDTDGCCSKAGEVYFSTTSFVLAHQFIRLVRSLGGVTNGYTIEPGGEFEIRGTTSIRHDSYRIVFNLSNEKIFHLERKQSRVKPTDKTHVYITGITSIKDCEATCISVDSPDELFLCGNFIPTHNTASGLSMLITQASRAIKSVIRNIDSCLIVPSIQFMYDELLSDENGKYIDIIGDIKLVAKGTSALIEKEQRAVRMLELIGAAENPYAAQTIGPKGFKYLWRDVAKSYDMDPDNVVTGEANVNQAPPGVDLAAAAAANAMPAAPGQSSPGGTPAAPATLDLAGNTPSGADTQLISGQGGHPSI